MPVNKEELAADLATPEYQELVKKTLSEQKFVIRSAEEESAFQENFKKDVIEKEIPTRIKAVHDQYDKDVEELTGLKREQNEKTYDFVKRAIRINKESGATLQQKISELEKKIADGDNSGATKRLLEEAENKYKASLKEKEELIERLQNESRTTKTQALLSQDYAGIKSKFKATLPPLFDRTEKAILSEAQSLAVIGEDGKLYVSDGQGGIKKDGSFNPVLMADWLRNEFKDVLDAGTPAGGAGSKGGDPNAGTDPEKITAENFQIPAHVKSGGELIEYMLELGLKRGSDQFNKIWAAHRVKFKDGEGLKR